MSTEKITLVLVQIRAISNDQPLTQFSGESKELIVQPNKAGNSGLRPIILALYVDTTHQTLQHVGDMCRTLPVQTVQGARYFGTIFKLTVVQSVGKFVGR